MNRKKTVKKISILIISVILCITLYILEDTSLGLPAEGELSVHYINVGQGDAALILTEAGSVLIDSGTTESGERVAAYIDTYIDTLDYLILSHPHEDHIGGAPAVFESIKVSNVILPDEAADSLSYSRLLDSIEDSEAKVFPAKRGDSYSLGDMSMEFLSPIEGRNYEDTNNVSAVVRVKFGRTSFLFTGDAETLVENELLESGLTLKSDVLKVGHHGSSTSSSEDFIKTVSPDMAIISCAKDNSYGHPHGEVVQLFEKLGIEIYRTDLIGDIVVRSDGSKVYVD